MSQPDMGSIFHIKKSKIYSAHKKLVNYQNNQNQMILSSSDTRGTWEELWCIYSCLQTQPRENWFPYVRREYKQQVTFLPLLPWRKYSFQKDILYVSQHFSFLTGIFGVYLPNMVFLNFVAQRTVFLKQGQLFDGV